MNNIEEIIQAIGIGLLAAPFLLKAGRALKAIELCNENLVLLNNQIPTITKQTGKKLYRTISETMFKGYLRISDHTNAITCGRKLLAICRECGDTVKEGNLGMVLAEVYYTQSMYAEAKELYERTNIITRKIGDRKEKQHAMQTLELHFNHLVDILKLKNFCRKHMLSV